MIKEMKVVIIMHVMIKEGEREFVIFRQNIADVKVEN
jgi:hypothetical protein